MNATTAWCGFADGNASATVKVRRDPFGPCNRGEKDAKPEMAGAAAPSHMSAIAAAAREGGDAQRAPGNAPQSGGTAASPNLHGGIA